MTWPLVAQLGTHVPAGRGDTWIHVWTFHWVKRVLASGHTPYFTHLLFYPDGVTLLYHNFAWVNIALWLPLQALFGEGVAYSLLFMFILAFNGFTTFLLAREVTGARVPAFFAGIVVAFWPYTLSHPDHPNLIFVAWIPLALLYLRRTLNSGRRRDALLAGVFIALVGITRWQMLVMGGFLLGFYLLYRLLLDRQARSFQRIRLLLFTGFVAGLLMLPLLAPVLAGQLTRNNPEELFLNQEDDQTDLLAYFIPSRYHPIWGEAVSTVYDRLQVNKAFYPFLGYTVLLLALFGLYTGWPDSRLWFLAALLYVLLALGPRLLVGGRNLFPLPYALIDDFFFIKIIRRAHRLNVFLSIPLAILVAYGAHALLRSRITRPHRYFVTTLLLLLLVAEFAVKYPTYSLETPTWFSQLAQEPGEFGLLTIPMNLRDLPDKANMYYQLTHGKPLVEGHVSRPPEDAFAFIESVPLLAHLREEGEEPPADVPDVSRQLRLLDQANVRYIILNKRQLTREQLGHWWSWLPQEAYHEDEVLVVYRTAMEAGRDYTIAQTLLAGEEGTIRLGLVQAGVTPQETRQAGSLEVNALWASETGLSRDYEVCLSLAIEGQTPAQRLCQPLSPKWPTSRWEAGALVAGSYALPVDPFLEAGTYQLTLSVREPDGEVNGGPAVVDSVQVAAIPREFDVPVPAGERTFIWQDLLRLHRYHATRAGETLLLNLTWQTLQRMDTSYKVFVHLLDPATGRVVAQADVIPRDWSYPTNWWEEGEVVADTIRLDLNGVPSGTYQLSVGLYDPATGERLSVQARDGENFVDNAVPLQTVEIRE